MDDHSVRNCGNKDKSINRLPPREGGSDIRQESRNDPESRGVIAIQSESPKTINREVEGLHKKRNLLIEVDSISKSVVSVLSSISPKFDGVILVLLLEKNVSALSFSLINIDLKRIITLGMVMGTNAAGAERIFSKMNWIKNLNRSRMTDTILNAIL
eukprot:959361_1